jgi:hypothetical protein
MSTLDTVCNVVLLNCFSVLFVAAYHWSFLSDQDVALFDGHTSLIEKVCTIILISVCLIVGGSLALSILIVGTIAIFLFDEDSFLSYSGSLLFNRIFPYPPIIFDLLEKGRLLRSSYYFDEPTLGKESDTNYNLAVEAYDFGKKYTYFNWEEEQELILKQKELST